MVAVVESLSSVAVADSATATFVKPVGTVAGKILVAFLYCESIDTLVDPAGFTQKATIFQTFSIRPAGYRLMWRRAGASEPASYVFTFSDTGFCGGHMLLVADAVESGDPFDGAPSTVADAAPGDTRSIPDLVTTEDDVLLLAAWGGTDLGGSHSTYDPAGFVELADPDDGVATAVAQSLQVTAGPSGIVSTVATTVDFWFGILAGIKSAPLAASVKRESMLLYGQWP